MRLNWLSNKGSLAPYIYLLLHILIVTGFIFTSPNIIDLSNYKYTILFWIDAVITLVLFFVVHNADPGYVPYDGVFFTDQEEAPHSASANLKYDSMMKLKAADSRIMYPGFDLSPSAVDNEGKKKMLFGQKSPGDDKSQFLKMTIGSTAVSKNMKDTLSSPNLEKMRREEEECDTQRQEENPGDMDQTRVDVSLSQEDITQRNEEMEYQASDNREGENTQAAYQVHSGFNDMSHIEESPKANREMSNFNEGKRFHEEKETKKPGHMDQYRVKYGLQLDDVEEEDHTYQTNNSPVKSKGNGDAKTDNGEVPRHQPYQNQSSTENTKEKNQEGSHDDSNSRKETLNHIEMVRTRNQLEVPDSKRFSNNIDVKDESFMSKDNQSQDLAGEAKPNQAVKDLENNKAEQKQLEALYVERRYCTACNLDQPLRSKHCRDCNRCVAQYDHHCPWIGTCIGEKNHLLFFFFLVFQLIELTWGEIRLIEGVVERSTVHDHWTSVDIWRIVVLIPATFFFILVGSLSVFHVYLATKNLTTWEFLSWSKISYLKEWQPNWGSPFSKGITENVRFFLARHKELSRWKMPKYKAPLSQQTL